MVERKCIYCGDDQSEIHRDHVMPVSFSSVNRHYSGGDLVYACGECNLMLSDNLLVTLEERAFFLIDKYKRRYSKVLKLPDWSEDDLAEMGSDFKKSLAASMLLKESINHKIDNLHEACYMSNFDKSKVKGVSTMAKSRIYNMLEAYIVDDILLTENIFISKWSGNLKISKDSVKQVLLEKDMSYIVMTFKYDKRFMLDVPIRRTRDKIRKEKLLMLKNDEIDS